LDGAEIRNLDDFDAFGLVAAAAVLMFACRTHTP
jgi:hypothetical protein